MITELDDETDMDTHELENDNEGDEFCNYEEERESMRLELASYLESLRKISGSDGKQLVSIPANFDDVSDAMNRGDLTSKIENPWSKYLLASKFEEDLNKDHQGRYKGVQDELSGTQRVLQGMAEIHLLDNQLTALSKKQIKLRLAEAQLKDFNDAEEELKELNDAKYENNLDDDENTEQGSTSSPLTSRSSMSRIDGTFLTRAKQSIVGGSVVGDNNERNEEVMNSVIGDEEEGEGGLSDRSLCTGKSPESQKITSQNKSPPFKLKKRPTSSKNKKIVSTNQRDKTDEIKLRLLMDSDDIDPYAFSTEDKDRIREIDKVLSLLRPDHSSLNILNIDAIKNNFNKDLEVLYVQDIGNIIEESDKSEMDQKVPNDLLDQNIDEIKRKSLNNILGNAYLAEQRVIREQKNYEEELDKKLFKCKSRDIDYSGLFLSDELEYKSDEYTDETTQRKHVGMINSVSVRDIKQVLRGLSQISLNSIANGTASSSSLNQINDDYQTETETVNFSKEQCSQTNTEIENVIDHEHFNEHQAKNSTPVDRQGIDRLLSEYRSEIVKLGFLRHTHRMSDHPTFPSSSALKSSRSTNSISEDNGSYDENNAYNEVSAFLQTRINQNGSNATSPTKHFDPRNKIPHLKSKPIKRKQSITQQSNTNDTVFTLNSKSPFWSDNSENNVDIGYVRFPPIVPKTEVDKTEIERLLLPPPKSRRDHYQSLVQQVIGDGDEVDAVGNIDEEVERVEGEQPNFNEDN